MRQVERWRKLSTEQKADLLLTFYKNSGIISLERGDIMPTIRSSTDLRNHYNEISAFCHETREPVFITKNGRGDLVTMSMESYEQLTGRFELYGLLQEGLDDVKAGRTLPLDEAMDEIIGKYRV